MSKNIYIYTPTPLEKFTRSHIDIADGTPVRLAKAPCCGKGLPKQFAWIEDLSGNFIGMVFRNTLKAFVTCPRCNGKSTIPPHVCGTCGGHGSISGKQFSQYIR